MVTAAGSSVLIRADRLALSVEGLQPHSIETYVCEGERPVRPEQGFITLTTDDLPRA